jgi:hypothetical protein
MIDSTRLTTAIQKLYAYLSRTHWNGHALVGPHFGIRFNARVGRFIKGYLPQIKWNDDMAYMQSQGYWVLNTWRMHEAFNLPGAAEQAIACSNYVLSKQTDKGFWHYPNPEWGGRIGTVEGCFAALALAETYARTKDRKLLAGMQHWYRFMIDVCGFQKDERGHCINYFANMPGRQVPNNSTLALWTFARFADVTGDDQYLESCPEMVRWLAAVQMPSGEFPYCVEGPNGPRWEHFLCFNYHGFQFHDLSSYLHISGDPTTRAMLAKVAQFNATGVLPSGAVKYECHKNTPDVLYYAAALGSALVDADRMGFGAYREAGERAINYVLDQQLQDGNFAYFSRRNYKVLADHRSYPSSLAMILNHLLRVGYPHEHVGDEILRREEVFA